MCAHRRGGVAKFNNGSTDQGMHLVHMIISCCEVVLIIYKDPSYMPLIKLLHVWTPDVPIGVQMRVAQGHEYRCHMT